VKRAALLLLLLPLASGCFWRGAPPQRGTLYSPNGEPLSGGHLGHPACEDALARWFDRVDADHAGAIDLREFQADAARQFMAMDLDKDGVLTPAELAQYRAPYVDAPVVQDDTTRQDERGRELHPPPVTRERADPVMLADTGLHNRVTRTEFLAYASRTFAAFDINRDGRLSRDELTRACRA
jgi:Ca2+-binding EF-hand superfamily protein